MDLMIAIESVKAGILECSSGMVLIFKALKHYRLGKKAFFRFNFVAIKMQLTNLAHCITTL